MRSLLAIVAGLLITVSLCSQVMLPHRHPAVVAGPTDPLFVDLSSYWRMDETSGTRYDIIWTNHFYDIFDDTATWSLGIITNSARFDPYAPCTYNALDGPDVSIANADFSVAAWVKIDPSNAKDPFPRFVAKSAEPISSSTDVEWTLYINSSTRTPQFNVSNGAGTSQTASGPAINTNSWYLLVGWHDSIANTVNIRVNLQSPTGEPHSAGCWDGTNPVRIGGPQDAWVGGFVDEVGYWKRVLSAVDITNIYNGGLGDTYPFAANPSLTNDLMAYWRLDETSGNRMDVVSTNTAYQTASTLSYTTGIVTNAAHFNPSPSLLYAYDNSFLSSPGGFTFLSWVNLQDKGTYNRRVGIKGATNSFGWESIEWVLYWQADDKWIFELSDGSTGVTVAATGTISTNTWYMLSAWLNTNAQTANLQVNTGTVFTTAFTNLCWDSTYPLLIGGSASNNVPRYWKGFIDESAYWRRVLSQAERTKIYTNILAGKSYPFE